MNIYFFYPSRIIGGAEYLFVNIANKLSESSHYKVFFIDYQNGFSSSELKNSVSLLNYKKGERVYIKGDSIVVMQLIFIKNFNDVFEFEGKYYPLFWGINPNNLVKDLTLRGVNLTSKKFRKKCGALIKTLIHSGNIILMDRANLLALETAYFFDNTSSNYVPVPIDDNRIKSDFIPVEKHGPIRFSWLGRLDEDKLPTLITFMNEIESFNKKKNCTLSVIGNGKQYSAIQGLISKYSYRINLVGVLKGSELDAFIDTHVDIGVGMGTSVLEFSKRGVPAILKGFMSKPLHGGVCNDYIITSEIEGYSLGSIDGVDLHNPAGAKFENKVGYVLGNYMEESRKCFDYVRNHHTIGNSSSMFIDAINNLIGGCNTDACNILSQEFNKIVNRRQRVYNTFKGVYNIVKLICFK